jgi:hypothetical protein
VLDVGRFEDGTIAVLHVVDRDSSVERTRTCTHHVSKAR